MANDSRYERINTRGKHRRHRRGGRGRQEGRGTTSRCWPRNNRGYKNFIQLASRGLLERLLPQAEGRLGAARRAQAMA